METKDNVLEFIRTKKQAVAVIVLFLLIILGLIIRSLWSNQQKTSIKPYEEQNPNSNIQSYESLPTSANIKVSAGKVYNEFKLKTVYYPDVKVNTDFTASELQKINDKSYVFSFQNRGINDFQKILHFDTGEIISEGTLRIYSKNRYSAQFLSEYISALNTVMPTGNIFTTKRIYDTPVVDNGEHMNNDIFAGASSNTTKSIYEIYLNSELFIQNAGLSRIIVYENSDTGETRIDLPFFLPESVQLEAKRIYENKEYTLTASMPYGIEFSDYVLNNSFTLTSEDISILPTTGTIIYSYDSGLKAIVPVISKIARLEGDKFAGLSNRAFYISEVE